MGGLLILFSAAVAVPDPQQVLDAGADRLLRARVGCGAIGFLDDFIKLTHRRSLGLNGRWKLLLLALITAVVGMGRASPRPLDRRLPAGDRRTIPLSWAWYPFLFLVIAGAANGVNLTDGIDGLAAGTGIIAIFTFTAMTVIAFIRSGTPGHRSTTYLDLVDHRRRADRGRGRVPLVQRLPRRGLHGRHRLDGDRRRARRLRDHDQDGVPAAPRRRHLPDRGALGDRSRCFSFKYFGRRVFLMTPIHHHFEMKAWSETKIMVRFWILTAILCACGFALYYRYYFRFFRG